ncbi:recombinase family protein [bacterium]|nr:recombinase family protein [bacterium]
MATLALCYIRQSYTRDSEDTDSPERQRANIQLVCDQHQLTPEWYSDVGGHRSGTSEDNHPGWLALKERLWDAEVVAVVANDLSRLHRNIAGLSTLIDVLEQRKITLYLAASRTSIDASTLMGQMFAQFSGLLDAYYAKDIALKARDSIAHRKHQGKTVGIPPFGSVRNAEGFLQPAEDGAWLLPDGRFLVGTAAFPPHPEALWRSYFGVAERILRLYASGAMGLERIAYSLAREGYPFRDRHNQPRPINREDVRRVVANYPEYGGLVMGKRSKSQAAYEMEDIDALPFIEERALFPLDLLRAVGQVQQARTIKPVDYAVKDYNRTYPLSNILYCAHCEALVTHHSPHHLHSRLSGTAQNGVLRYRHKAGVNCGSHSKSVPCQVMEAEFLRLIRLLTVRPEALIPTDRTQLMHNLEVDAVHTYFVGDGQWAVHNGCDISGYGNVPARGSKASS